MSLLRDQLFGAPKVALAFMVALLPCVLLGLAYLTDQVDGNIRADEERLVRYGISGWEADAETRIVGQADWDDALRNLGQHFDLHWAHIYIGQFLYDVAGMEQAYVVDADNRPIYAAVRGRDQPPEAFAALLPASAPLIAAVRRQEQSLHQSPEFGTALAKPIRQSSLRIIDGRPYLVTASLVQADFDHVVLPGLAPIVVTLTALDGTFLRTLGDRLLLGNLQLMTRPATAADAVENASVPLLNASGIAIGAVLWTPHRPGLQLFKALVVPIVLLFSGFIAAAWLLDEREQRAAAALLESEQRSKYLALHDHLTGLPNRAKFNEMIELARARLAGGGPPFGLLLLDMDRFKQINDSYGHAAGDEMIRAVAARLGALAGPGDLVARLGGDEFALLLAHADPTLLDARSRQIHATLASPIQVGVGPLFTGVSIGGALVRSPDADRGEALRQADVALYRAKAAGRGQYRLYQPQMDSEREMREAIQVDLRQAIIAHSLTLAYQIQVDEIGRPRAAEALLRWQHPERGALSPEAFVPIAEECGLIVPLGQFVLDRALRDSRQWPGLRVAINVSPIQLRTPGFLDAVQRSLHSSGADPAQIELEITEALLIDRDDATLAILNRLRQLGFSIALDDFGTGYSSLAYLRRYPVDTIKIDRSFIIDLGRSARSEQMVSAIIQMAGALGLAVIAEGVETEMQWRALRRAGCRCFQGFLFHAPASAEALSAQLSAPAEAGGSSASTPGLTA